MPKIGQQSALRPRPLLGSAGFWRPCPPRKGPSDRIADPHAWTLVSSRSARAKRGQIEEQSRTAGARSSPPRWPTARAAQAGRHFCSLSEPAACTGSNGWWPTTHAGLRAAIREDLAEAAVQRSYVHVLSNALVLPAAQGGRRLPSGAALAVRPPQ